MADKMPFMKFYVGDFLQDTAQCSPELTGFWIKLLCQMHKNGRRGYLCQANGHPWTPGQIALATGCTTDKVAHLSRELIDSGVASVTDEGVIFNRRMVRESKISEVRRQAGSKGGTKTSLLWQNQQQTSSKHPSNSLVSNSNESSSFQEEKMQILPEGGAGDFALAKPPANRDPTLAVLIAQEFSFVCTKRKGRGMPFYAADGSGCEAEVEELLRHVAEAKIRTEIKRPDRNRSEWFGDMAKRLMPGQNGKPVKVEITEAERRRQVLGHD